MNITPLILDSYNGPVKQLSCRICKHVFYLTQQDYQRLPEVRFCHECSLILLEELQVSQGATASTPPTVVKEKPVVPAPARPSVQPVAPVPIPQPRTIHREKMTIEQLFEEASILRKTWRNKEALRSYEEILQREPHCLEALSKKGSLLHKMSRSKEALIVYDDMLRLDPGSVKAHVGKGWALRSLRRYDESLAAFDMALQLDSSSPKARNGKQHVLWLLHRDQEAEEFSDKSEEKAFHVQILAQPCHVAKDYFQKGNALLALDRGEEAIQAFEACLRLDPLYLDAYDRMSLVYFLRPENEDEKSLAIFDRATSLYPECAGLHRERASVLIRLKRYQEALLACERALELDDSRHLAWVEKGECLSALGRHEQALEALDYALSLCPDSRLPYRHKAEALRRLKRYDEALEAYDQEIRLDPLEFYSYWGKIEFLKRMGRDEDVLATYDQFIEYVPHAFKGHQEKLFFLSERNRYADAVATCEQCLARNPHEYQAYEWQGRMLSSLDRTEEALLSYEEAIRLQPQDGDLYRAKAEMLEKLKRYDEALDAFDQAIQLVPGEISIYKEKGELLMTLKRYEDALPLWQKAARLDVKNAAFQDTIGDIFCKLQRYEEAVKAYDRAIRLDRGYVFAYRAKAEALEKQGKQQEALIAYEEALTAHDKALQSEPQDFYLHFFRADILKHLRRYEEAKKEFDRAQELAPHPIMKVHCIFANGNVRQTAEAAARLQVAGKEVSEKTITAEIELIHKEKKFAPMKSSVLFQPVCLLIQEQQQWSGTAKQFKDLLCSRFPDELAAWGRSPRRFVEELKKITPALQEEGIEIGIPPETTLIMLSKGVVEEVEENSEGKEHS